MSTARMMQSKQTSFLPSSIGTWAWEIEPNILFADPTMSSYFGLTPEEGARGQPVERYLMAIHHEDRSRVERNIELVLRMDCKFSQTYRVHTIAGTDRCILAEGRCYRDARGRPRLYPGYILDITDQVGRSADLEDIRDHLSIASLKAQVLGLGMLGHLISMALLEAADVAQSRRAPHRDWHLN